MMRIRRTRSGPTKRAMLALTASLSGRVDVVARRGDDIGDVAKPEYKDVEDTTETPKGRVLDDVGEAGGGLRRSGGRDLNHASVRTSDVDSFDGDSFRLRLHWEEGYFWQEYKEEMWWCMQCDECEAGDSIKIEWCGSSDRQKFARVGSTYRPMRDLSLCMTTTGHSEENPIRLYKCDDKTDQKFDGHRSDGKFEIHPRAEPDNCVSQLHHPKSRERVYPQSCRTTRSYDTTYWNTF